MKLKKYVFVVFAICNSVYSQSLDKDKKEISPNEVQIYIDEKRLPSKLSRIGSTRVGYPIILIPFYMIDHRYKSYYEVLKKLQFRAAMMGGNLVVIKKHQFFTLGSPPEYHYVRGEVYFAKEPKQEEINKELESDVLLHIYNFKEYLPRRSLYVNDSLVMELQNDFKRTLRLKRNKQLILNFEGKERLRIKLDSITYTEYYVRFKGCFRNNCNPIFQLMPFEKGKLEFESFKAKNTN